MVCRFDVVKSLLATFSLFMAEIVFAASGVSPKECQQLAKTQMESSFCMLIEKGFDSRLPNFQQFRQNPPLTQYLLLKPIAKKAGMTVSRPASASIHASKKRPVLDTEYSPANDRTVPDKAESQPASGNAMSGCRLQASTIRCGGQLYRLVENRASDQLHSQYLGTSNTLRFSARGSNETKHAYLSRVYPVYIQKMVLLGLGDTTMSLTKFASIYDEVEVQGLDFPERFYDMYEMLKKERKTQGVLKRYNDEFPPSIDNCMYLDQKLIVCDNVKQNWVYKNNAL